MKNDHEGYHSDSDCENSESLSEGRSIGSDGESSLEEKPLTIHGFPRIRKSWRSAGDVTQYCCSKAPLNDRTGIPASNAIFHLKYTKSMYDDKIQSLKLRNNSGITFSSKEQPLCQKQIVKQTTPVKTLPEASDENKIYRSELHINLSDSDNLPYRNYSQLFSTKIDKLSANNTRSHEESIKTVTDTSSGFSLSTASTSTTNPLLTKSSSLSIDESTCSVDNYVENYLQQTMKQRNNLPAEMKRRDFFLSHFGRDRNLEFEGVSESELPHQNAQCDTNRFEESAEEDRLHYEFPVLKSKSVSNLNHQIKYKPAYISKRDGSSQTCSTISLRAALKNEITQWIPWKKLIKRNNVKHQIKKSIEAEFNKPTCTCSQTHVKAKTKEILRTQSMSEAAKGKKSVSSSNVSLRRLPSVSSYSNWYLGSSSTNSPLTAFKGGGGYGSSSKVYHSSAPPPSIQEPRNLASASRGHDDTRGRTDVGDECLLSEEESSLISDFDGGLRSSASSLCSYDQPRIAEVRILNLNIN